jgi:hypothetical protein
MAYMVFGLPETFFADVSVGTLATATSLDRPTELMFSNRQQQWSGTFVRMSQFVLERSLRAPKGRLREAFAERAVQPKVQDIPINVNWPPIIEGDIPALMGALIEALTLNGFEPTGIDQKTGIKAALSMVGAFANIDIDVEGIIEEMFPDAEYKKLMDRTPQLKFEQEQALTPPSVPGAGAPGGETPGIGAVPHAPAPRKPRPKRIATKEMADTRRELRSALKALMERKKPLA